MELEEETRLSHDSTKTAEQEPNFSEVIAESCPAAAEKSENARNLTPISMPPTILETACSPDNQRHRRKFSSLVSQEQQQFFIKNSSGSVGTPSRLTVRRRPSSSTVYSMRASSSSPFPHYPIAQLTTVPADVSPLYPTSDLGSSPRSSFSTITTAGSSSASSSITDGGGRFSFSKEMTPQDATVAVVSSACMVYSPAAPFSPFIVSPNEDAVFQSPTVFRSEAQKLAQRHQRPYFSFDPKSPSFLLHSASTSHGSRDSAAILQEKNSSLSISDQKTSETSPAALISDRERSRSDSDVINSGGQKSKYTGIQDTNFFDLSLPPCIVETESQAVKTLEQCSILEFMLKNQLFASLAFRQDSVISSSSSTPLSPFRAADAAGKFALSSSAVGIFNRAPCLTLPTTPVATKIDQSSSVEDNSINKRSRSESDMSLKAPLAFRSMTTEQTLTSLLDESHTSSTTTIKSHKCAVCQKAFGRSDMLTRHMRLHTGIKPYACRVCGQVFSRSDHLSTHQRTHTGEKPYHCPQCTYSASRRDMITRHMRTHLRQRLGASSSMAGVGGNSSSAPSASFDSSNCECTTRLSDYPTKIDFDFSKEFQHGSVIRRINSAKDLYDSEDVTGLIHIEEMTAVKDKTSDSIKPSPVENVQALTGKNLNSSSVDRPNAMNLAVRVGGGGTEECCSVSSSYELSTNEIKLFSYPLYKRRFEEGGSEKAEQETGCSTAGGQSGINSDMEKPTTGGDFTRTLESLENIPVKNESE